MAQNIEWEFFNEIIKLDNKFQSKGSDPYMLSKNFQNPFDEGKEFLAVTVNTNKAFNAQVFWMFTAQNQTYAVDRQESFHIPAKQEYTYYLDLNKDKNSKGLDKLRFDSGTGDEIKFSVKIKFITRNELPQAAIETFIKMQVYTSKLHYNAEEKIDYELSFYTKYYYTEKFLISK